MLHADAAARLLSHLFRLVVALVLFKRPLRRGVETKRESGAVAEALAFLLYLSSRHKSSDVLRPSFLD
jgi:hypothetical protein